MKKIIDRIANCLVALKRRKDRANEDYANFTKRGNNGYIVGLVVFGIYFFYTAYDLYKDYGNIWLASIPVFIFAIAVFIILIRNAYRDKLRNSYRNPSLKLMGFNMDFNERVLNRIYTSLIRYEFLDENLTRFTDFYNVLVFDFDEHDSVLHFNCTQWIFR